MLRDISTAVRVFIVKQCQCERDYELEGRVTAKPCVITVSWHVCVYARGESEDKQYRGGDSCQHLGGMSGSGKLTFSGLGSKKRENIKRGAVYLGSYLLCGTRCL